MAKQNGNHDISTAKFGSCCNELARVLTGNEFESLISTRENGILFMAVGLGIDEVEAEEEALLTVDHPIFYCPFCGTKLQDSEAVSAQLSSEGGLIQ